MNVYIHGSFMNDNYGDFLLYDISERIVKSNVRETDCVYSSNVDKTYDTYVPVERRSKFSAIFESDLAIFTGGGYFGEPTSHKIYWNVRCLWKHLLPAFLIALRGTPYAIIGAETGPLSFGLSRMLMKYIANHAEVVSVRNDESREFLKSIGVKGKVLVKPDLVMGANPEMLLRDLNDGQEEIIRKIEEKKLVDKKIIVLHLTSNPDSVAMESIIGDIKRFKDEQDVFYIIVCDQGRKKQNERAMILSKRLSDCDRMVVKYDGPWLLSQVLNLADATITDKLHVGIVSTLFRKEVISVALHPKSIKFYRLINRREWTMPLSDIRTGDVYNKMKKLKFEGIKLKGKVFEEARGNKKLLENFLKNNDYD